MAHHVVQLYFLYFVSVYAGPSALIVNIMKNIENSSIVVQWDVVDDFVPTVYKVTWGDRFSQIAAVELLIQFIL